MEQRTELVQDCWHPVMYRRGSYPDQNFDTVRRTVNCWQFRKLVERGETTRPTRSSPSKFSWTILNPKFLTTKSKLSSRQVNALDELCRCDFIIEHRPGKLNLADGLSKTRPSVKKHGQKPNFAGADVT
ncbi:hypothetical protein E4U23_000798 [Claviceps purpurea]|nr:hypothetical protein E4U23_000798 [Claviceps purpurea]